MSNLGKLNFKILGLSFLSILFIGYLIWVGTRQHPIITVVGMKPASYEVTSRGFFYTRKLVYLKRGNSAHLYEEIVKKIESSDFMHGMNSQKIVEKNVSDFTARSLGLVEGGDYEFTLLSSEEFYCYIVNRRDDVYIVIRD